VRQSSEPDADGSPRARTRLEPGVRRELILGAADRVLRERNPADVTFETVAEAAGVSRALVYNYFGDRPGLLAAVYLRTLDRLDASLLAALDPSLPPAEQLRPLAHAYLDFAEVNGSMWQALASTGAVVHPAVRSARRTRIERLASLWGGSDRARIVARTVTGMLEAATVDWVDDAVGRDLVVATVCQLLATGLEGSVLETTPLPLPH